MTVISSAAPTPSPLPIFGAIADLTAAPNFVAVFDGEMATVCPVVPVVIKDVDVSAQHVVPFIADGTTMGEGDQTGSFDDVAAPDLPLPIGVASVDSSNAVVQFPNLILGLPIAIVSTTEIVSKATTSEVETSGTVGFPTPSRVRKGASQPGVKLPLTVDKRKVLQQVSEPTIFERTSKGLVAADRPLTSAGQSGLPVLDHVVPEAIRASPLTVMSNNARVERLLAALSHESPAERQWLDTVIRDLASVAVKSGEVRFRVEPEGYGRMTIERTADRLEISVSEPRSMVIAEAARPQVVAGAATLGVPVTGATVVLDQSGQRGREERRQRRPIEHLDADKGDENYSANFGRYA